MKVDRLPAAISAIAILLLSTATLTALADSSQNLVVNGDFENGNTGFTSAYSYGNVSGPGAYFVGKNPSQAPGAFGDWCNCGDHTSGTGNMMIVNGGNSASSVVWEESVTVTPSTNYVFSYWGAEVDHDSNSLPHLQVKINGQTLGSSLLPEHSPDNGGRWENYSFKWKSGSAKSAQLAIFDLNTDSAWNDFMLDDISFSQAKSNAQ